MKSNSTKTAAFLFSPTLLILAGSLAGCGRQGSPSAVTGKVKETWEYWDALNRAAVAGEGIELFRNANMVNSLDDQDAGLILADISAAERARCSSIEALPVLNVDANVIGYAADFVRLRGDVAALLDKAVALALRQEQALSGESLAGEFFLELVKHHDDENAGWNALLEETQKTGTEVQQARSEKNDLAKQAAAISAGFDRLKASELALRGKLAQMYQKEFPPLKQYLAEAAKTRKPSAPALTKDQFVQDLLHREIDGTDWKFEQPEECVSLKVVTSTNSSPNTVECQIRSHVKGWFFGNERDLNLALTYEKVLTRWKLRKAEAIKL